VCEECDRQFDVAAQRFDEWLKECRNEVTQPRPSPPTTAERVHDRAINLSDGGMTILGNMINSWYLAVAVERLLALESAGIPT